MNIEEILAVRSIEDGLPSHDIPQAEAHALPQPSGAESFRAAAAAQPKLQMELEQYLEKKKSSLPPGVRYGVKLTVLPMGKPGSSAVTKALIRAILSPASVKKTQDQCRREVLAQYPGHTLSRDWGKPLPEWALRYAQQQIRGGSALINQTSVPKGTSFKSLHRQIKRLVCSTNSQTFTVKLTVTPDTLFLNGLPVKITSSKSGGHSYQYARVNVQSLLEAVEVH